MGNTSNKHEERVADVLEQTLEETAELLVVNPAAETVRELFDVAAGDGGHRSDARLLAPKRTLKDAFDDFLTASNAADLIEQDALAVRAADLLHNTLLVTDDAVFALVTLESQAAALAGEDDSFIDAVETSYRERWESADPHQLRTPPISRVRETLEEEIGAGTREDFDRILEALESTPDEQGVLDEVAVSLLVAARNNVLLYDISRWGEDVGIASKATFSRTKTRLEDHDLIDTEKVPIDVGRPRLRLQLGEQRLREADPAEFLAIVRDELAA
jgi:hypothetical protein